MNTTSVAPPLQKKLQRAIGCLQTQQYSQAKTLCQSLVKTYPKHPHAWHLLAIIEKEQGQMKSALYFFDKAIKLEPRNPDFHYNLGLTYQQFGQDEKAIKSYKTCLSLNPQNPMALDNLGVLYQKLKDFEQALPLHQQALAINANLPSPHNNLGECFRNLHQAEQAIICYENAIKLSPGFVSAMENLGNLYKQQGDYEKANQVLNQAHHIAMTQGEGASLGVRWNQATLLLLEGRFEDGWRQYECRIAGGKTEYVDYGYPFWQGGTLENQPILIVGEQGVGDEVMFASCFPDLIHINAQCTIECDPRLQPLFQRSFPNTPVVTRHAAEIKQNQQIQAQLLSGSLPRYFRNHLSAFPKQKSYLTPCSAQSSHWKNELSKISAKPKVGISWRGGKEHLIKQRRSIPLDQWQAILTNKDFDFINLQYGDCAEEIEQVQKTIGVTIHDMEGIDSLKELDNYAALIDALDLVITIDNSLVHLAGALGQKTWALLPYVPDWRWQLDTKQTPWYPSVELFRQPKLGAWDNVLETISHQLSQFDPIVMAPKSNENKLKALLINDTSAWYHWGCTCTSRGIIQALQERGFATEGIPIQDTQNFPYPPARISDVTDATFIDKFISHNERLMTMLAAQDIIVINGEGTLHNTHPQALMLLLIAKIAKERCDKKVHIINHSCYPDDKANVTGSEVEAVYQHIYQQMDSIAIREPISAALMETLGIKVQHTFDCLPLYLEQQNINPVTAKKNTLVIAGSVAITEQYLPPLFAFMRNMQKQNIEIQVLTGAKAYPAKEDTILIERLQQEKNLSWTWVEAKSAEEWLQTIANAKLLVSGRFHHSIAAAFLKTPFITLNSNTPKIQGILNVFETSTFMDYHTSNLEQQLTQKSIDLLNNPDNWLVKNDILDKLRTMAKANFDELTTSAFASLHSQ